MASQQPNAWQSASRSRNSNSNSNSNSASRTPQNRSGTQSPNQPTNPSQPPRSDAGRVQQPPVNNVWTQRSSMIASSSNGPPKTEISPAPSETFQSVNSFNAEEVKRFLGRETGTTTPYKPAEVAGASSRTSGSAWSASNMANNQPFFVQLAKQVATIEGGG